jgi:hypothetical protein
MDATIIEEDDHIDVNEESSSSSSSLWLFQSSNPKRLRRYGVGGSGDSSRHDAQGIEFSFDSQSVASLTLRSSSSQDIDAF